MSPSPATITGVAPARCRSDRHHQTVTRPDGRCPGDHTKLVQQQRSPGTERDGGQAVMFHPQVGVLPLRKERLAVSGADSMALVIYHPVPESDSAEKLSLLASLTAPPRQTQPSITIESTNN
jgi:hypothetical protein